MIFNVMLVGGGIWPKSLFETFTFQSPLTLGFARTLMAISAFGSVLGLAGALLAIPLAAIAQLLLDVFLLRADAPAWPSLPGRDRVSVVRYELQELALDVRKRQRGQGGLNVR